ncbi:hypothetical protein QR90_06710 [Deinococcus radiopugnans]|uniref:Phage portal protein n=1 Tax=Deinococcus radiopugnans TaxID=57497 RepID=A0A0A7KFK9_9DEIO|nr:hypothetical protein [Deinococcus radiopugnans]AIZ44860.1 hypothetical protein QR90_06710 [Deinococcus radiopugnans]
MLYGPDGELLHERGPETSLRGGWREGLPWEGGLAAPERLYGVNREDERLRSRRAYFTNPLFAGAVDVAVALLTGDEFSYGTPALDKAARDVLDAFWSRNRLGEMVTDRVVTEYLLDGELCAVFPLEADDPGQDAPARFALVDVSTGLRVESSVTDGVTAVLLPGPNGGDQRWETGRFAWTANSSLWNDPRGWPVARHAVDPAAAYLTLMNHRLNTHELQARILGVQKVFVDREDPNSRAAFSAKSGAYRSLPRRGGILTMAMVEGKDGKVISDSLDFMTPGEGAANAETDARALLRLTGLAFGLPEHYLGEGGNVTRTTAESMTLPAVRRARKLQAAVRGFLDELVRREFVRRFGPARLYTLTTWDYKDDGKTRVKRTRKVDVSQIEIPWVLPAITQDSLQESITRAEAAARNGWASPQTLSASLGFDPGEEDTRMAAVGLNFGQPDTRAAQPTAPPGGGDDAP